MNIQKLRSMRIGAASPEDMQVACRMLIELGEVVASGIRWCADGTHGNGDSIHAVASLKFSEDRWVFSPGKRCTLRIVRGKPLRMDYYA